MKIILVSLVSDQTIPNVQLIKEFSKEIDEYLFITTESMEQKKVRESIVKACKIPSNKLLEKIKVDQFSFEDIEEKLDQIDFEQYEKVVVNLTGGTKVMTLAAFDYFKQVGAEIYYLTGQDDTLIKLSPGRFKKQESIKSKVTLREYLESYGFSINETQPSGVPESFTEIFFYLFTKGNFLKIHSETLGRLRSAGRNKNNTKIAGIPGLNDLLLESGFPLADPEKMKINKYEVKYLTGEWFEEYVASKLKKEMQLTNDYIATGIQINKANKNGEPVPNEMDVMFVNKNKIYTIECKTSVFIEEKVSSEEVKRKQIIGETLYKSDSLQRGLGLYAKTFLFILDSLADYQAHLRAHLDRAELFGIKVIDKDALTSGKSIKELLNIKI